MIIELHMLQSFPVSNLNRDDIGQPKSATFGGKPRARISSQCQKRSARRLFCEFGLDKSETAVRTTRLAQSAAQILADSHGREPMMATAVAIAGVETLGLGMDPETQRTKYLLFVGQKAATLLADYCESNWSRLSEMANAKSANQKRRSDAAGEETKQKKRAKAKPDRATLDVAQSIFDAGKAVDVALFGRMIADNKDFNVEAACQVAHAISTHTVAIEYDYYTAVDDLLPGDESGADMIGTIDFNAACYYRYANLDLAQLTDNLKADMDLIERAASAWLNAFIHAVPTGMQNSMAARTMPDTLLAIIRDAGAWNLANAFLTPVASDDLMAASTAKLIGHLQQLRAFYGTSSIHRAIGASVSGDLPGLHEEEKAPTLNEFITRTLTAALA